VRAPNIAKPTTKPIAEAEEKTRFANSRGAKIGSLDRRSIMTKTTAVTRPTTSNVTDFQPSHASDVPPSDVKRIRAEAESGQHDDAGVVDDVLHSRTGARQDGRGHDHARMPKGTLT
jgi:hypothetical protein